MAEGRPSRGKVATELRHTEGLARVKGELHRMSSELNNLKENFARELKPAVRTAHAELVVERNGLRELSNRQTRESTRACSALWKYESERVDTLQDKKHATWRVRQLENELLAQAKRRTVAERQVATARSSEINGMQLLLDAVSSDKAKGLAVSEARIARAEKDVSISEARIAQAEKNASIAVEREESARLAADEAREEADGAAIDLAEAEREADIQQKVIEAARKRLARLEKKNAVMKEKMADIEPASQVLSAEELCKLGREARWQRDHRERIRIKAFFDSYTPMTRSTSARCLRLGRSTCLTRSCSRPRWATAASSTTRSSCSAGSRRRTTACRLPCTCTTSPT